MLSNMCDCMPHSPNHIVLGSIYPCHSEKNMSSKIDISDKIEYAYDEDIEKAKKYENFINSWFNIKYYKSKLKW